MMPPIPARSEAYNPRVRVPRRSSVIPVAAASAAWIYTWIFRGRADVVQSDFQPLWDAARAWSHGTNPYTIPGPFNWSHHLLAYPMPAVIGALPFAALPLRWADSLFVALGFGALAAVLARGDGRPSGSLWVFVSASALFVAQHSQWS